MRTGAQSRARAGEAPGPLPAHNLWTPGKEWLGQNAYLIGGGPSLEGFNFTLLAGRNVIGCNDAFHLGPEIIRICVFGDAGWWHRNKWQLEKYAGRIVTNAPSIMHLKIPNVHKMRRQRDGIHNHDTLGWNYSTGALAINLAISLGAVHIWLLGYDLCNNKAKSHWHNHGKPTREYSFQRFIRGFRKVKETLPAGVRVLNVSDGTSKLDCFETVGFPDLFRSLQFDPQASITSDSPASSDMETAVNGKSRSESKPSELTSGPI